jgi:hypothetical protein
MTLDITTDITIIFGVLQVILGLLNWWETRQRRMERRMALSDFHK